VIRDEVLTRIGGDNISGSNASREDAKTPRCSDEPKAHASIGSFRSPDRRTMTRLRRKQDVFASSRLRAMKPFFFSSPQPSITSSIA
jgi:hypothetical protein